MFIKHGLKYSIISLKMTVKVLFALIFLFGLSLFFASCSSNNIKDKKQSEVELNSIEAKMIRDEDPSSHVRDVRKYLLDNYTNMPKNIKYLIENNNPSINQNSITLEYTYSWKLPDNRVLNVYTTPPPLCDILDVKVTD